MKRTKYFIAGFSCLWIILAITISAGLAQSFDLQGHRGARGLAPENTLPAFKKALDLGVTTLELDVVISSDKQVVVSHEPYMSSKICCDELGIKIEKKAEKDVNLYQLPYESIKAFDCGSMGNSRFPEQEKVTAYKPLLREVIEFATSYALEKELGKIFFNVELKSSPKGDGEFHPEPGEFSDIVIKELQEAIDHDQVIIQSFDLRILQYVNTTYPDYTIALLNESTRNANKIIDRLGFQPDVYSPYFKLLSEETVQELQVKGIKVIPWTVNEVNDMQMLLDWKVDGLITDYPNRFFELVNEK